jgi:hypothetical protein
MQRQPNLAERDAHTDHVILGLLISDSSHRPWSIEEVEREVGRSTEDGLARFFAAGLLHPSQPLRRWCLWSACVTAQAWARGVARLPVPLADTTRAGRVESTGHRHLAVTGCLVSEVLTEHGLLPLVVGP